MWHDCSQTDLGYMGLLSDLILNITDFRHKSSQSLQQKSSDLRLWNRQRMDADGNNLPLIHYLPHDQSSVGGLDIGFPGNLLCSKSSLKVIPYNQGNLWNNQTSLYTRSNPPIWATWRSKGFRIHPHLAEKMGTLLFSGTLGHTVENDVRVLLGPPQDM